MEKSLSSLLKQNSRELKDRLIQLLSSVDCLDIVVSETEIFPRIIGIDWVNGSKACLSSRVGRIAVGPEHSSEQGQLAL